MARFRIAFSREWSLGRWGYLDRFFHDLGGHPSEPSGLANAWIVEYRGQARHLGRELAKALNIQATDYRQFGPIFDIEELASQRRKPRRPAAGAAGEASAAKTEPSSDTVAPEGAAATAADAHAADGQAAGAQARTAAEAQGPSWVANTDVEDADLAEQGAGFVHPSAQTAAAASSARAQARWDDLFRIRSRSGPTGRTRANAIAGASRRRPPADPRASK